MLQAIEPLARTYVATRITQTGWPGAISFPWVERLAKAPKRLVNGIARYALLRWALGEDDDLFAYPYRTPGHKNVLTMFQNHPYLPLWYSLATFMRDLHCVKTPDSFLSSFI